MLSIRIQPRTEVQATEDVWTHFPYHRKRESQRQELLSATVSIIQRIPAWSAKEISSSWATTSKRRIAYLQWSERSGRRLAAPQGTCVTFGPICGVWDDYISEVSHNTTAVGAFVSSLVSRLGYNVVYFRENLMFRRNISAPSSASKNKRS
jgi:hypothetical protein